MMSEMICLKDIWQVKKYVYPPQKYVFLRMFKI